MASSSLDDLLKSMGVSSKHIDDALHYGSDDLAAVRTSAASNITHEGLETTAQQLDNRTDLVDRINSALDDVPWGDMPDVIDAACQTYEAGERSSPDADIAAVLAEFDRDDRLASHMARHSLCVAVSQM